MKGGLRCPDCGEHFPNAATIGHCSGCCRTFVGLGAFDAHRVGKHGVDRRCEIGEKHWQDKKGYWHIGQRGERWWEQEEAA